MHPVNDVFYLLTSMQTRAVINHTKRTPVIQDFVVTKPLSNSKDPMLSNAFGIFSVFLNILVRLSIHLHNGMTRMRHANRKSTAAIVMIVTGQQSLFDFAEFEVLKSLKCGLNICG